MELKERIINEAAEMFVEQGLKSVRMDDIAIACGISKRTLYENFSDRENLIRQSIDYYMSKHEAKMQEYTSMGENVIDEFWILFAHGSEFRDANKKVIMDMIKFYPNIFGDFMKSHHHQLIANSRERLERGIEQGLFLPQLDTEFMAITLTNYLYGLHRDIETLMLSPKVNNNPEPRSLQFAIMLYFRGITTEKGRKYIDSTILMLE